MSGAGELPDSSQSGPMSLSFMVPGTLNAGATRAYPCSPKMETAQMLVCWNKSFGVLELTAGSSLRNHPSPGEPPHHPVPTPTLACCRPCTVNCSQLLSRRARPEDQQPNRMTPMERAQALWDLGEAKTRPFPRRTSVEDMSQNPSISMLLITCTGSPVITLLE